MFARILSFLALLPACSTAQDTNTYSKIPKLESFFEDAFLQFRPSDYRISNSDDVIWKKGRLTLGDGVSLEKAASPSPWVNVKVDLAFPKLTEDGQSSELKIWFDLRGDKDRFVWFRQTRELKKTRSAIFVVDTTGNWDQDHGKQLVKKLAVEPGQLANGVWKINYRFGLLSLQSPNQKVGQSAFVNSSSEPVERLIFQASKGELKLNRLQIDLAEPLRRSKSLPASFNETAEKESINKQLVQLFRTRAIQEAREFAKKASEKFEAGLGKYHPGHTSLLNDIGVTCKQMGATDLAESYYLKAIAIKSKIYGIDHPDYATTLKNLASLYDAQGRFMLAKSRYLIAKKIDEESLNKVHPRYADTLNSLGIHYWRTGKFQAAKDCLQKAIKIREEVFGKQNSNYASSVNNLAMVYKSFGDFEQAEPLYLESMSISEKLVGRNHIYFAASLNNMAELYRAKGDYERAEPYYLEAIKILADIVGKEHPNYASCLNNLALSYEAVGLMERAKNLLLKSKSIREMKLGKKHPQYAASLANLAQLYSTMGDFQAAEKHALESKAIFENVLGRNHRGYTTSLNNLALIYRRTGKFEAAEKLWLEVGQIHEKTLGSRHPNHGLNLNNLAELYDAMGRADEAEQIYRRALESKKKLLGSDHPDYARSLINLARLLRAKKLYDQADPLLQTALEITRTNYDRFAGMLSEQQLRERSNRIDFYLSEFVSNSIKLKQWNAEAWRQIIRWKGMLLIWQKENQVLANNPETKPTYYELKRIRSQLARHVSNSLESASWTETLQRLKVEEEVVERKLNRLRNKHEIKSTAQTNRVEVPKGCTLIDFRQFDYYQNKTAESKSDNFTFEPHYLALIQHDDQRIDVVNLGLASRIDELIARWRKPIEVANRNGRPIDSIGQRVIGRSGDELRKILWLPLEKHLKGAELILISPDRNLGRFPFIALPGRKPNSFLLEERKIVYLPVPGLLPQLLAKRPVVLDNKSRSLLLGNIDFGLQKVRPATVGLNYRNNRILGEHQFSRLPGSKDEVENIGKLFQYSTLLTGEAATEKAFQASLPSNHVLHVATHGFFRSPKKFMRSMPIDDQSSIEFHEKAKILMENPDTLSGLAFANANSSMSKSIDESENDGILYSAEIAMLPLDHVELTVLSACETSLGVSEYTGEGLLGIQRAFQVAGVKSTIASYWKIDDRATQLLMNKFYENLLNSDSKLTHSNPASQTTNRLDALRDAQLWMLNNSTVASNLNRGVQIEVDPNKLRKANADSLDRKQRTHPRYWAAFALSGDWR